MSEIYNANAAADVSIANQQALAGSLVSTPLSPQDLAAQRAKADAWQAAQDARYAKERADERQERYDLLNIVNRQTAMHAALMLGEKPATAAQLVEASGALLAFLTAKS